MLSVRLVNYGNEALLEDAQDVGVSTCPVPLDSGLKDHSLQFLAKEQTSLHLLQ